MALRTPAWFSRFRLLVAGLLVTSIVGTLSSTLLMMSSADLNRRSSAALLPLLQDAQDFEREVLCARIAFIYYVTINKPGSLERGWARYQNAAQALKALRSASENSPRGEMLSPRIETLEVDWDAYRTRLRSTLALVQGGSRSGPAFDQAIAEWAADGETLVVAARNFVTIAAALSGSQSAQTGDLLRTAKLIIAANGAFCVLLSLALAVNGETRSASLLNLLQKRNTTGAPHRTSKKLPLRGNVNLTGTFLLLISVVLGTGAAALRCLSKLNAIQADNMRSQAILLDAEGLKTLIMSAESDTRGYLFSTKQIFLVSQASEIVRASHLIDKLRQESEGDTNQSAVLVQIRSAFEKRAQAFNHMVSVRQSDGASAVLQLLADGHGLVLKHQLQEELDAFQANEYQRIVIGKLRAERTAANSKVLILFAALPAALTITILAAIMAHLLSQGKLLQAQLSFRASHDSLTGLPNRVALEGRFEEMVVRARQEGTQFAVLAIDLDRFKEVNDTFGHQGGDTFLKELATRFRAAIRQTDSLIRVGGDEFLCLADAIRIPEDAELIAGKLVAALGSPVQINGNSVLASASIGIATFPDHGEDLETLTKHADDALYRAKDLGRNQSRIYNESEAFVRAESVQRCLSTALQRDCLHLVYQPQFTEQGTLRGFEALLRLTHPNLGPISPAEFVPIAERTRLILPIGAWVLHQACVTLSSWIADGFNPGILSVNVSASQLASEQFAETVLRVLRETGIPAHQLELELTESMVMVNPEIAARQMSLLAAVGVRLAIDDFGTGYSSLGQLHKLPIETLKIDRMFVKELSSAGSSRPIVEAIVALGKALGLEIIAEGVETPDQRNLLSQIGCDRFQGYLFARPLEEARARDLLADFRDRGQPSPAHAPGYELLASC